MLTTAQETLGQVLAAGVAEAEVFIQESRSLKITVYQGDVEELASSTGNGMGIRAFIDGSVGYAFTTDMSAESLAATARAAVANAEVAASDEFNGLPLPADSYPELDLFAAGLERATLAEKVDIARELESEALGRDERIVQVEAAQYIEAESRVAIASSAGISCELHEGACYAFLQAIARQDGEMQTGMAFTTGREPGQLRGADCGREAADRALMLLGGSQCESMSCPVVMDPYVTASLFSVIGSVLSGESVQKRRSMFAGKEGEVVADPVVELLDDGLHPDGLASSPFDGEGVPCRRTALIKDGVLQGFIYDTYTARKAARESTGNAARSSYRAMPHVGASNLRLVGGSGSAADIIAAVDRGIFVTEVSGIHSGANPVSGDFSVGAAGVLIKGGELAEPVREITIAGNLMEILKGIKVVGGDNRWVPYGGSIHAPTLLVEEMAIGGK